MGFKDKKILVTGGTGFIGAAVVNKLLEQDYYVNIISHPDDPNWRINNLSKCKIFNVDLKNFNRTEKLIEKINPELIFHIAGIITSKRDKATIHKLYSINFDITKNLILALQNIDYDLFINTGSGNEYGDINPPFQEGDCENPTTPYGTSKLAATSFCNMIANTMDKPIITVRPFLIYGPKQVLNALIPSLIFSAIQKRQIALTTCKQTRDFIYIEDVVDAYLKLANNIQKVKGMGIFNIGSGKETQLLEVVNLIKSRFNESYFLIGKKSYRFGETMSYFSSIEKISKIIDWTPKWSLEEGINATIDWWLKNERFWIKYKNLWT